jgi:FlaA1/EpsC-like NDP-sugar epimerase
MSGFVDNISRRSKWFILLFIDIIIIVAAFYIAFSLRFGEVTPFHALSASWPMLPTVLVAGVIYEIMLGLPKLKLHAFELRDTQRIGLCALLLAMTAMSFSYLFGFVAPRSVPIIFGILFFIGATFVRIYGLFIILYLQNFGTSRQPVAIYGAGAAGMQLTSALHQSSEFRPVVFIDDKASLQSLMIFGLRVYAPSALKHLVKKKKIKLILIAMPSVSENRNREIVKELGNIGCEVKVLPSYVELIERKNIVESLRAVSPENLLGRDKRDVILPGVALSYTGKSVLITGAGGSIGSELCRQVLKFSPTKLILFEQSEFALYQIERELSSVAEQEGFLLVPILGSVLDAGRIAHVLKEHSVQIVLHAAAYKHVPLVQANELAGLANNVLGTKNLADMSIQAGIERFVLISTDKAVRPTNIMGASKRLAELVVQDCDKKDSKTIFSMVRFGNVLGSSGSVIPLFREQILKGGPITLTHNEVTRFFMSISEAANLVLIAGSLATGGDVFILDMGKSIKIRDLAKRMIELSGLSVQDEKNPYGDIAIEVTGLRPGEKLYEELLIGGDTLKTPHPKILRAKEVFFSAGETAEFLASIRKAVDSNNNATAHTLIERWVVGYKNPDK